MVANIVKADDPNTMLSNQEYLSGSAVSSLYRLRDIDTTGKSPLLPVQSLDRQTFINVFYS
jgi:hypothetical protein